MDGACTDGQMYLQNREKVKECTGGGPVGETPMLKSDGCSLNQKYKFPENRGEKKSVYLGLRSSLLYIGGSELLAVDWH
jgi:hypothetical protein